jgi:DNA polymerase-3 subunit gamma/tau
MAGLCKTCENHHQASKSSTGSARQEHPRRMSTVSLTAKYRPQTFEQVAGQDAVKRILSRASSEQRIAPAYLFSGTRGVGKTTLARIFAKALNCEHGPAAEPCNECLHCRQITAGSAVDVVEIDAASNRGIEEARRLKEDIGYAPIDARYKVFIIDEAHMLTVHAFNALLKTLEEPPRHATFVLATTEPHKILPTIVSRCQHFVFQRLTQPEITAHLQALLDREGAGYEEAALRLIAKRAAGSVRDGMSLLGQVLALGGETLREADVRHVLGLAGQEVFQGLVGAVLDRDLPAMSDILHKVLDQGLDLGFFLRELGLCFRNMFILSRMGEAAPAQLELTEEEIAAWSGLASRMHDAHIHACWQMVLEGQRKVLTSLEPGLALELLLLNLALMPELAAIEDVPAPSPSGTSAPTSGQGRGAPAGGGQAAGSSTRASAAGPPATAAQQSPAANTVHQAPAPSAPGARPDQAPAPESQAAPFPEPPPAAPPAPPEDPQPSDVPERTFQGFLGFVQEKNGEAGRLPMGLRQARGEVGEQALELVCANDYHAEQLQAQDKLVYLRRLLQEFFGRPLQVNISVSQQAPPASMRETETIARSSPVVQAIQETFEVKDMRVEPRRGDAT